MRTHGPYLQKYSMHSTTTLFILLEIVYIRLYRADIVRSPYDDEQAWPLAIFECLFELEFEFELCSRTEKAKRWKNRAKKHSEFWRNGSHCCVCNVYAHLVAAIEYQLIVEWVRRSIFDAIPHDYPLHSDLIAIYMSRSKSILNQRLSAFFPFCFVFLIIAAPVVDCEKHRPFLHNNDEKLIVIWSAQEIRVMPANSSQPARPISSPYAEPFHSLLLAHASTE